MTRTVAFTAILQYSNTTIQQYCNTAIRLNKRKSIVHQTIKKYNKILQVLHSLPLNVQSCAYLAKCQDKNGVITVKFLLGFQP